MSTGDSSRGKGIRRQTRAIRYLAADALSSLTALVTLVIVVATALLSIVGIGLVLAGPALSAVRRWADHERSRAGKLLGRPVASPYPPAGSTGRSAVRAHADGGVLVRDLLALALRAISGLPLAVFAVILPLVALNSALLAFFWWAFPADQPAESFFVVTSWWSALASLAIALFGLRIWLLAPFLAHADAATTAHLLAPNRQQELALRAQLEQVRRRSAVSAHTAELRRIERDLHDAAQNRLVAVTMYVGMAQRQVETGRGDPAPALAKAQSAASDALNEMRRVIRGIYPPVLAEEGLVPAIGALADLSSVPTRLHVDRPAPTAAAVDAALYFSIAEALTNVAKHSGATQADVRLSWQDGERGPEVLAVVTDDGRGGAEPSSGSGLSGMAARLEALGGWLDLSSPSGGPTTIRMGLPCEP
ncbi:sensor histidine kinase [Kribbella deserti]|uniref:histidine kinase n=1 Tax=Kribbella deserti TaxID=1926257 RepID=A0ABV6QMD3_9ACTN